MFSTSNQFTRSFFFSSSKSFTKSDDFSQSSDFSQSLDFTNSDGFFRSTKKIVIPVKIENTNKGNLNVGVVSGVAIACAAVIGSIILAALLINRKRKLKNEIDSDGQDMAVIDTNSISNVIDNPLYSQMNGQDDPFESDFYEIFI